MSYRTYDGRGTWDPAPPTDYWQCDCGHENADYRHVCYECGLAVTERAVELEGDGQ